MITIGLDMYLNATRYLSEYDEKEKAKKIRKLFPEMFKSGNLDYVEVKFEAGYWRKANHIHNWFVKNCQNGEDDCGYYNVSREQLRKLLDVCKQIKDNPKLAKELLPTQEGFFFGGTDYDKYYYDDTNRTIDIIEKCLKLPEEYEFEYHSSW